MAPAPGVHIPLRYLRALIKKGAALLRTRLAYERASGTRTIFGEKLPYEPTYAQVAHARQAHPIHTRIKVAKRWYSTRFSGYASSAASCFGNAVSHAGHEASRFPASNIGAAVNRLTNTSPFATTLRPKLTGGTLPRTASGYSLGYGGPVGARFFSHAGPTAPAQVIAQVTAGVRAFLLGGKDEMEEMMKNKGQSGVKGSANASVRGKNKNADVPKGAFVDFNIVPTITCLSPFEAKSSTSSLDAPGFIESLTSDFNTIMNDLKTTLTDIQKMKSTLGDLPIALVSNPGKLALRIYFAGEDPKHVELLCQEAEIRRGVVGSFEDALEEDISQKRGGSSRTSALSTTNVWAEAFELLMPTIVVPNRSPSPQIWDGVHNNGQLNWMDMLSTRSHTPASLSTLGYSPSEAGESTFSGSDSSMTYHNKEHIFEEDSVDVAHQSWSPGSGSSNFAGSRNQECGSLESVHRFLQQCEEYRTVRHPWGTSAARD